MNEHIDNDHASSMVNHIHIIHQCGGNAQY